MNRGFSPKRAKAVATGKVVYKIFDGSGNVVFSTKSFIVAVQHADLLQKNNPGIVYTMKLEEVDS